MISYSYRTAAQLTHMRRHIHIHTHPPTPTHTIARTAVMWVVTCPLDDFHHVGGKVTHTVISCAVVVNTTLPSTVRVLLQDLATNADTHKYSLNRLSCLCLQNNNWI